MEDALISPEGIAILTGAGLIAATDENPVYVHTTEEILIDKDGIASIAGGKVTIENLTLSQEPTTASGFGVYVMLKDKDGYIISEPFSNLTVAGGAGKLEVTAKKVTSTESTVIPGIDADKVTSLNGYSLFVDYYIEKKAGSGVVMVDITPDKFAGSYYIEASTLFRDQATGRDDAAEFIIPNGKIQSNFTFTMAGSGDPSERLMRSAA